MGLLCPECKSMSARLVLNAKTNKKECRKPGCDYSELNDEPPVLTGEIKNKKITKLGDSNVPFSSYKHEVGQIYQEYNFLSHSFVGKSYTVIQEGLNYKCDCPGFHFKKKCRHIAKAKKMSKKPLQAPIKEYPPSPPDWL